MFETNTLAGRGCVYSCILTCIELYTSILSGILLEFRSKLSPYKYFIKQTSNEKMSIIYRLNVYKRFYAHVDYQGRIHEISRGVILLGGGGYLEKILLVKVV